MVVKMYVLTSLIICLLSVNDFFSTSLLLRDPESLVLIVCKHQKVKYFLEFCLRSQVGFKSSVPLSKLQHIMSFQAPSLSNGGLGRMALAMSGAQEKLWNQSRSMPAQCGDETVPVSFLLGH